MKAAEFGCGSGKFALLLAEKLKEGKVYGFDIQKEPLSVLEKNADQKGLFNVVGERCDLEKERATEKPDSFFDLVFIPNLLFQVRGQENVIKEASRVTKKGGTVVVIDWKKEAAFGPKEGRIDRGEILEMAKENGLTLKREFEPGAFHFALIFEK